MPSHFKIHLILSSHVRLCVPSDVSVRFPHQNPTCTSLPPRACPTLIVNGLSTQTCYTPNQYQISEHEVSWNKSSPARRTTLTHLHTAVRMQAASSLAAGQWPCKLKAEPCRSVSLRVSKRQSSRLRSWPFYTRFINLAAKETTVARGTGARPHPTNDVIRDIPFNCQ
jgi:hypothetical protein